MSIKFTKNPYEFDKCPSNKPLIPLLTLGIITHTHKRRSFFSLKNKLKKVQLYLQDLKL